MWINEGPRIRLLRLCIWTRYNSVCECGFHKNSLVVCVMTQIHVRIIKFSAATDDGGVPLRMVSNHIYILELTNCRPFNGRPLDTLPESLNAEAGQEVQINHCYVMMGLAFEILRKQNLLFSTDET